MDNLRDGEGADGHHGGMDDSGQTYVRDYFVPQSFLDRPDWEDVLWDDLLQQAHKEGVMPIGPISFTVEKVQGATAQTGHLTPGMPMDVHPLAMAFAQAEGRLFKVHGSVMIGASL